MVLHYVLVQLNFFSDGKRAGKTVVPEGLRYQSALISRNDEAALVEHVRRLPFREFEFHQYLGKRRVVSFGRKYDFSSQRLQKAEEIPDYLLSLRSLAALFANLGAEAFEQVLVTEYADGAGIGWHRDKAVFGQVVGISLLAPCTLRFRRKVGSMWERANLLAEPRSAYHLSGPARMEWEHSISRVDTLRYSITFRSMS
ncbi:MAG TPA: alpha-ketoglutarate-dependent dioxygenase AlkB [Pyrinomonadaceae bacterium]|nr:alpha-ketoglutarate-dependent dioxygenase AlkB [Pyrinomonadaceae bacterium]